jgi:hypothetical protein
MRTRLSGGVAGESGKPLPLCRSCPGGNFLHLALELVPEGLIVDGVVELHLGALDDGSQFAR